MTFHNLKSNKSSTLLFLLGFIVLAVWLVYSRETERVYPADYDTIEAQIKQLEQDKKNILQGNALKSLSYHWQLAAKLADQFDLILEFNDPKGDVPYVYQGAALRWDGVISGPSLKVISYLSVLQKEVPLFLNQMESKDGTLNVLISIIGGAS